MLLALRRDPAKGWSAQTMSRELYIAPDAAFTQLEILRNRGIVAVDPSASSEYKYQPGTTEQEHAVSQLSDLYRDRRVAVVSLIYSEDTKALRAFSDAFKLRKDK
jgi:hypothetical protein